MTPLAFLLAATLGSVGRLAVGRLVCSWQALLVVNTVGAAILGYVVHADLSSAATTIIGVGFCGALTTYSSFALEVRSLGWTWGAAYAGLTIGCVCAAASLATSVV